MGIHRSWFALALDGQKDPVDAAHLQPRALPDCPGIVDDDKAAAVAERLMGREMFSGWGIRTLACSPPPTTR